MGFHTITILSDRPRSTVFPRVLFFHFLAFQKLFSLKALLDTNQVNAADSYLKEPKAVSIDPLRIPGTGTSLTQEPPSL